MPKILQFNCNRHQQFFKSQTMTFLIIDTHKGGVTLNIEYIHKAPSIGELIIFLFFTPKEGDWLFLGFKNV